MNGTELSPHCRRKNVLDGYKESDFPVKREPEEDFKCYAETTMNEILGWYGFEKVDSRDTQGLNLTHFASNNSSATGNNSSNGVSPPSSAIEGSDASEDVVPHHIDDSSRLRSDSLSPGPDASSTASDEVARQHQQMVSALSNITKHPGAPDSPNLPPGYIVCAWCQKVGVKLFTLKTPNGSKAFCSELCFTQCRRASFKKNKICDWCKHVRHTVNYVDFQDGEQQLQFCSDKCLNQYKMNIFCKETQAHLQMHTHLKEAACKLAAAGSVNLITPDLWLRDCKTNRNSNSPQETIDVMEDVNSDENVPVIPSPIPGSESPIPASPTVVDKKDPKDPKPVPTPPAKEKEKSIRKSSSKHSPKKISSESKSHSSKHHREKKSNSTSVAAEFQMNQRQSSPIQASPPAHIRNGQMTNGSHSLLSPPPLSSIPKPPHHVSPLPPRHPTMPTHLGPNSIEHNRQPFIHPNLAPPSFQFFAQQQMEAFLRSQHNLDLRSKLPPNVPIPPWMIPPFPQMHPPLPPPPPHIPPSANSSSRGLSHSSPPSRNSFQNSSQKNSHHKHHKHSSSNNTSHSKRGSSNQDTLLPQPSLLPPVTVMVPFPLMLPVPMPIPVPIPIPPQVMDKYSMLKLQQQSRDQRRSSEELKHSENTIGDSETHQKRKNSAEFSKQRKRHRSSSGISSSKSSKTGAEQHISENRIPLPYFDSIENLSLKLSESNLPNNHPTKHGRNRTDLDTDSRSYSPLSDVSNEGDVQDKMLRNGDLEDFSGVSFSSYNLSLMRSSPSMSQMSERRIQIGFGRSMETCKSPSPTNLSVRDKQNLSSSNVVNFKKKHLRDHPSLMT